MHEQPNNQRRFDPRADGGSHEGGRVLLSIGVTTGLLLCMSLVATVLFSTMRWSLRSDRVTTVAQRVDPAMEARRIVQSEAFTRGKVHYMNTCTACHTPDGYAMQGLGLNIVSGAYASSATDEELSDFIWRGRNPGEPDNLTGRDMPSRGGNPALSRDDVRDIVVYIRGLEAMEETGMDF